MSSSKTPFAFAGVRCGFELDLDDGHGLRTWVKISNTTFAAPWTPTGEGQIIGGPPTLNRGAVAYYTGTVYDIADYGGISTLVHETGEQYAETNDW
jgi:hypothetical protein